MYNILFTMTVRKSNAFVRFLYLKGSAEPCTGTNALILQIKSYGMRIFFFLFFSILSTSACRDAAESDPVSRKNGYTPVLMNREDSLQQDVLQGHDEAMAKMSKLSKQIIKVQSKIDSLGVSRSATPLYKEWTNLKEDLLGAEYVMNQWMEEFRLDSFREDRERRIRYLEAEKEKVIKVKERIFQSLARADSLLLPR